MRLRGVAGVVAEAGGGIGGVESRFAQRLAIVERVAAGEFGGVGVDEVGELEELRGAFRGGPLDRSVG